VRGDSTQAQRREARCGSERRRQPPEPTRGLKSGKRHSGQRREIFMAEGFAGKSSRPFQARQSDSRY
jgi:hypothetical protein